LVFSLKSRSKKPKHQATVERNIQSDPDTRRKKKGAKKEVSVDTR